MVKKSIGHAIRAEEQAITWSRCEAANLWCYELVISAKGLLKQVPALVMLGLALADFPLAKEPADMRIIM